MELLPSLWSKNEWGRRMTREEAIARIKDHMLIHKMSEPRAIKISESLDMAIEALEQEPCEDAINRQAVIDVIERWLECSDYNEAERHIMRAVKSVLYDSPSVNPQPKNYEHILDKIRPEITECAIPDFEYHGCGGSQKIVELEDVLEIIDKYKEENGGKEYQ